MKRPRGRFTKPIEEYFRFLELENEALRSENKALKMGKDVSKPKIPGVTRPVPEAFKAAAAAKDEPVKGELEGKEPPVKPGERRSRL